VIEDEALMRLALAEARTAMDHGDVPVGAVVIGPDGAVLASRHNERELTGDPTAHAEILALRDAAANRGQWRLEGCTLYVTLEPCLMCSGALVQARIGGLVYGAADLIGGGCNSLYNFATDPRVNHNFPVRHNVLGSDSAELLKAFFADRRA
jgi:tRNA(adenine34) deaminase